jgi:hypothetical protein
MTSEVVETVVDMHTYLVNFGEWFLAEWQGWVSPDGHKVEIVASDHNNSAYDIIEKQYPDWDWENDRRFQIDLGGQQLPYAPKALEYKGWVRVAEDGTYSVWNLREPAKSTLIELLSALPPDTEVAIDLDGLNTYRKGTAEEVLRELM